MVFQPQMIWCKKESGNYNSHCHLQTGLGKNWLKSSKDQRDSIPLEVNIQWSKSKQLQLATLTETSKNIYKK